MDYGFGTPHDVREALDSSFGMHEEVLLPEGISINRYDDECGNWYSISAGGMRIGGGYFGEYGTDPVPNSDTVFADLVSSGCSDEDAQQVIDHLSQRGLVI